MNAKYTTEEVEAIDYVSGAIPVMFLLIFLEMLVGWLQGKRIYRTNDAINRYTSITLFTGLCTKFRNDPENLNGLIHSTKHSNENLDSFDTLHMLNTYSLS